MDEAHLKRFIKHYHIDVQTGCWLWDACKNERGYGSFNLNGKATLAHRVSYSHYVGLIEADEELDHLCRVHNCVNPDHLEAVPHVVNVHRGLSLQTHCKRGHALTPPNVRYLQGGGIRCKACAEQYHIDRHKKRYTPHPLPIPTHCPKGHEYTLLNTLYSAKGVKLCRECRRLASQRQYDKRRKGK